MHLAIVGTSSEHTRLDLVYDRVETLHFLLGSEVDTLSLGRVRVEVFVNRHGGCKRRGKAGTRGRGGGAYMVCAGLVWRGERWEAIGDQFVA